MERAWSFHDIGKPGAPAVAPLYAHSWDLERTGDIAIQFERDCLFGTREFGTSHGSPYGYDRNVPLIFFGPGVVPGRVPGAAATVDIAPTLAARLGVEPPITDGTPLSLY